MNNDVFFPFNIYLLEKKGDYYEFCVNAGYINSQITDVFRANAYKWAIPPEYTNTEYTNENPFYPRNSLNLPLRDFDDNLKGDITQTFRTDKTCDIYLTIPKVSLSHYPTTDGYIKTIWYRGFPPYDYINQFNIVTSNDEDFEERYLKNIDIKGDIGSEDYTVGPIRFPQGFNYFDDIKYPGRIYIKIANIEIKNNNFFIKYFFRSNVIAPIKYFRLGALSMRNIRIIYKTISKYPNQSSVRLDEAGNEKEQGSLLGESAVASGGDRGDLQLSGLKSGSLQLGRLKSGGLKGANLQGAKTLQTGALEASEELGSKQSSSRGSDTNGVVPDSQTSNSGGDSEDSGGSDEESGGPDTDIESNAYDMARVYFNVWSLSDVTGDFESPYLFDKTLIEIESLCKNEIIKKINFINESYFYSMYTGQNYNNAFLGKKYKKQDLQVYQIILVYQESMNGKIICKNIFEDIGVYNTVAKGVNDDNNEIFSSNKKGYQPGEYTERKPMTESEAYSFLGLDPFVELEKIETQEEENVEEEAEEKTDKKPKEYEKISLDLDKIVELINFEKDENEESPKGSGDTGEDNG